jgi:hypothetical protein
MMAMTPGEGPVMKGWRTAGAPAAAWKQLALGNGFAEVGVGHLGHRPRRADPGWRRPLAGQRAVVGVIIRSSAGAAYLPGTLIRSRYVENPARLLAIVADVMPASDASDHMTSGGFRAGHRRRAPFPRGRRRAARSAGGRQTAVAWSGCGRRRARIASAPAP